MTAVGVNLLWARAGRVGGSEDYLVRQLLGMQELAHEFAITAYAPAGFAVAHPDLQCRVVAAPWCDGPRAVRVGVEHTWLAGRARRDGVALLHHGGGTVPRTTPRPAVVTIHDLQWHTYPQYVSPVKLRYLRWATPRAIRRATVVTTPSEFVKRTIVEAYGINPEWVFTVRHGVEPSLGAQATDEATLRARYGLGDSPVVVYPAMTHPHKRHDFLLGLVARQWSRVVLVAIGAPGAAEHDVGRLVTDLGIAERVVRPGRVPAADRDGLVKMARALVFPSEYEGFGAPVLEAMALGTPVVASDRGALPEVVGDAGLVLPLDEAQWAGALDVAEARRAALIAAGQARVQQFTAALSARDLVHAYRAALGGG